MQSATINQIKDWLQTKCLAHPKIKSYEWESEADSNTELDFPVALCMVGGQVTQTGVVMSVPLSIILMDLVNKGDNNKYDVSSDMLEVAKDLTAELRAENDLFILDENTIGFQDFYDEKFDTEATGWILTATVKLVNDFNICYKVDTPVFLTDEQGNYLTDETGVLLTQE
jgi:hypothetical protein